jgi:hypothetical protein
VYHQLIASSIITQTIQQSNKVLTSNVKYNQLNAVVQRFVARSTQEGTNNFNKILDVFTKMTQAIEQNNFDEYCTQHNLNYEVQSQVSENQMNEIDRIAQAISPEKEDDVQPCGSKDVVPKSPFLLVSCRNPVGRPKNSTKSTVTSFTKQIKRKTSQVVKSIKSTKLPKIAKRIITSTATTTTITTSTTTTTKNNDDTLEDIEELEEEISVLEKNCVEIDDDSDLPSL